MPERFRALPNSSLQRFASYALLSCVSTAPSFNMSVKEVASKLPSAAASSEVIPASTPSRGGMASSVSCVACRLLVWTFGRGGLYNHVVPAKVATAIESESIEPAKNGCRFEPVSLGGTSATDDLPSCARLPRVWCQSCCHSSRGPDKSHPMQMQAARNPAQKLQKENCECFCK